MKRWKTGFLCGAILFTGIAFGTSAIIANAEKHGLDEEGKKLSTNKPVSIDGHLPVRELSGEMGGRTIMVMPMDKDISKNASIDAIDHGGMTKDENRNHTKPGASSSDKKIGKLPVTHTVNDIEVTVHSIRVTEKATDFEVTITNNSDKDKVTLDLQKVATKANISVKGRTAEAVEIASDNPDFANKTIRPKKELHGWIRNQGLKDRDIVNLKLALSVKGVKEKTRAYSFLIDCTKMKFRTL
ncbi:hypothetical protein [Paenibacillus alvei]|uniref:Uncharacterized protein n=1 Tax=Paenibacillus alvei TaxID=44250 RepID=A0A383RGS1_PAEAL|nr:hypothetical protein [Paenibacillus alvei]SYX85476.1 conserved exported protein of unknown function [Paenibacillus alvei]